MELTITFIFIHVKRMFLACPKEETRFIINRLELFCAETRSFTWHGSAFYCLVKLLFIISYPLTGTA